MTNKNTHEADFLEALNSLNAKQRQAVETIEGPVLVVAGPGTGKTQILALRLANILYRTDLQPENVLALTFTESGAKAMRERLRRYLGPLAYRVPIFTFHGFASRLITEYPESFPRIIGGRPATDIEKVDLIETILEDTAFSVLRPLGNQTHYVPTLLKMISELKQSYISPTALSVIIAKQEADFSKVEKFHKGGAHKGKVRGEYSTLERELAKNRELHSVYLRYEAGLRSLRWYDFDDMLNEAIEALTGDIDLLRNLQETYQYILADEHQDVNGAQNKILELLCNFHDQPNIFVVGDEKQAIYRFQGASLENFLYFTTVFPDTVQISLTDNYRSGQKILDLAQALITVPDETMMRLRTPLLAKTTDPGEISWRHFSHQAVEDDWIVDAIKKKIDAGTAPSEIAVILRTNQEVENFSVRLRQAGFPVEASAEGDILQHPILQTSEGLLQAVLTEADESALVCVVQGAYWGLSTADIVKLLSARSYETSLALLLTSEARIKDLGLSEPEKALNIMKVITEARARAVYEPPQRVVQYLLEASGLLTHVMANDPIAGARVVRRIYDEIEAMVSRDGVSTLGAVRKLLATRRTYNLPMVAPYIVTSRTALKIMTAHKAKGLEFAVVFVPHLQDARWSGKAQRQAFKVPLDKYTADFAVDPIDDERRLLYVAFTRAKKELHLSASAQSIQGKDTTTFRLITELCDQKQLIPTDVSEFENEFSPVASLVSVKQTDQSATRALLQTLLLERGLSASSFNNLLANPWDFLFDNLLRVPTTKPLHLQFGTALHQVLDKTTKQHTTTGVWPENTDLLKWLKTELHRLPITTSEYTQLHEKGSVMLVRYLEHLKQTAATVTREELKLQAKLELTLPEIPEILLTGKMDRVDFATDGQALRVLDYKTGKPKTRGEILGETKNSDGNYLRQVQFYVLLLSRQEDERLHTDETVISFVEPLKNGSIREESFKITALEIDQLKTTIKQVVQEFWSGDFLNNEELAGASKHAVLAEQWLRRNCP